jgi:hypothetical protein
MAFVVLILYENILKRHCVLSIVVCLLAIVQPAERLVQIRCPQRPYFEVAEERDVIAAWFMSIR